MTSATFTKIPRRILAERGKRARIKGIYSAAGLISMYPTARMVRI